MKEFITIITPTYNRKNELNILYNSLKKQTNLNFIWMVIDDGSTDGTDKFINSIINKNMFNINFIRKKNGGKHTALNRAFDNLKTELFFVVDSDDYLTNDAVETIYNYYVDFSERDLAGFVFLKGYSTKCSVTVKFKCNEFIGDYINDVINKLPAGDRAEVFYTKILKKNRFPEFKNEKFIGEGYFWNKISSHQDMLFVNKIIYICEYLDNGLTKAGRKMRINNPLGGMEHAKEYIKSDYSLKLRLKNYILYMIYYRFAKCKGLKPIKIKFSLLKVIAYLPSLAIFLYWKFKY